jgi:hypothetical protein
VRAHGTRASFLVIYAPAFLVLTDAAQRMRTCTRDLDMTLGADVRARVSVKVGMGSAGLVRALPPVCAASSVRVCTHQSEERRGGGVAVCVAMGERECTRSFEAQAANECRHPVSRSSCTFLLSSLSHLPVWFD